MNCIFQRFSVISTQMTCNDWVSHDSRMKSFLSSSRRGRTIHWHGNFFKKGGQSRANSWWAFRHARLTFEMRQEQTCVKFQVNPWSVQIRIFSLLLPKKLWKFVLVSELMELASWAGIKIGWRSSLKTSGNTDKIKYWLGIWCTVWSRIPTVGEL